MSLSVSAPLPFRMHGNIDEKIPRISEPQDFCMAIVKNFFTEVLVAWKAWEALCPNAGCLGWTEVRWAGSDCKSDYSVANGYRAGIDGSISIIVV